MQMGFAWKESVVRARTSRPPLRNQPVAWSFGERQLFIEEWTALKSGEQYS
jgi:hypothetical protein